MPNHFESLKTLDDQSLFDQQLRRQVELLWPKEPACLERHGLLGVQRVVDFGTGNGFFLCRLAERYPLAHFVGVEANARLAELARREALERGLGNVEILAGDCLAAEIPGGCDLVLARLMLYCAADKEATLARARGLLRPGGRIAVVDVDDGFAWSDPPSDDWLLLFRGIGSAMAGSGADRLIGRKLPHLLLAAGFTDLRFEIALWFSSTELSKEAFVEYWGGTALAVHRMAPGHFGKQDLERFQAFLDAFAASATATAAAPLFIASAARP